MPLRRSGADRVPDTRAWTADLIRSGLDTAGEVHRQVVEAISHDHPRLPAEETATRWIAEARGAWEREARDWSSPTDHERLRAAFDELERRNLLVLQGCADHWAARAALDRAAADVRGVLWFLPTDVWHAIDAGMLEVNLWHADGANAAADDPLLDEVVRVLAEQGLPARFDEGRIEISAHWRRRPGT